MKPYFPLILKCFTTMLTHKSKKNKKPKFLPINLSIYYLWYPNYSKQFYSAIKNQLPKPKKSFPLWNLVFKHLNNQQILGTLNQISFFLKEKKIPSWRFSNEVQAFEGVRSTYSRLLAKLKQIFRFPFLIK